MIPGPRFSNRLGAVGGLALLVLAWATPGAGLEIGGLYEAEVPVEAQTAAARRAALRAALAEVLVKLTGRADIAEREPAAPLLEDVDRYVQQYRYREPERPETGAGDAPGLRLWVRFDGGALRRRAREAGLAVWGDERPVTLIWLAVQEADERLIVGADAPERYQRLIREAARARGLPVIVPLMDLEDRRRVGFSDVWGGFLETVRSASRRYGAQALLAGRAERRRDGSWGARWWLLDGGTSGWDASGASLAQTVSAGIGGAAGRLAERFAGTGAGTDPAGLEVAVSGVAALADYLRVAAYLASLSPVDGVDLLEASPERVRFRLRARGGAKAIERAVLLGDTLAPSEGPAGRDREDGRVLRYRLVP